MVWRLAVVAGAFALLVGCEPEFYGDLGRIGFATNLAGWTPARPIARGAPLQVAVAEVGGKDEGWTDVGSGFAPMLRRFDPTGAPLGPEYSIAQTFTNLTPWVAVDPDGGEHVIAWTDTGTAYRTLHEWLGP